MYTDKQIPYIKGFSVDLYYLGVKEEGSLRKTLPKPLMYSILKVNAEFFFVKLDISAKFGWIFGFYTAFLRSQYPLKSTFNT